MKFSLPGPELTITTERIDDLPLLIGHMDRMGLSDLLDEHFPTHGHWKGLSLGKVTIAWLAHILSQADHRMKYVQQWAQARLETISRLFDHQEVRALDFSDDRLALVLQALSQDERWDSFETDLNSRLLRVYDLQARCIRLDATTASGYFSVTEDGLFQFGHSKDHRPDLPQVKIMLSTLDPLALPLTGQIVPGSRADDPLYVPALRSVRRGLARSGLLYVGDCKMAALDTRSFLAAGGDYYLCPLPASAATKDLLSEAVEAISSGNVTPVPICRRAADGSREQIAEGFERTRPVTGTSEGEEIRFTERLLVVRSLRHAASQTKALEARIDKALEAIEALNQRGRGRKRLKTCDAAAERVAAIVKRCGVQDLLDVAYEEEIEWEEVRAYKDKPQRLRAKRQLKVCAQVKATALEHARERLGWRIYVTNQPQDVLPLEKAVQAYRNQYRIERGMSRLKGQPLSLSPMYVQRDDHVRGLVRLLSLGLRVLILLEHQVRERLAEQDEVLTGLDPVHRRRKMARPTAERLLKAFEYITLTTILSGGEKVQHVTPLTEVQQYVLTLLDLSPKLYLQPVLHSAQPP
jgi:transposase